VTSPDPYPIPRHTTDPTVRERNTTNRVPCQQGPRRPLRHLLRLLPKADQTDPSPADVGPPWDLTHPYLALYSWNCPEGQGVAFLEVSVLLFWSWRPWSSRQLRSLVAPSPGAMAYSAPWDTFRSTRPRPSRSLHRRSRRLQTLTSPAELLIGRW